MRRKQSKKVVKISFLKPAIFLSAVFALLTFLLVRDFAIFANNLDAIKSTTTTNGLNADISPKRLFEQFGNHIALTVQIASIVLINVAMVAVAVGVIVSVMFFILRILNSSNKFLGKINYARVNYATVGGEYSSNLSGTIPITLSHNLN
jgi:hypothetical protein